MTGQDPILLELHAAALSDMKATRPKNLDRALRYQAEDIAGAEHIASSAVFLGALAVATKDDPLVTMWEQALRTWDSEVGPSWSSSEMNSSARRSDAYELLGIGSALQEHLRELVPVMAGEKPVVISDEFDPWYKGNAHHGRPFYWPSYRKLLEDKGWTPDAVTGLDAASDAVVSRLSDPTREEAYQSKGLVVGYVQSGKTANFTGVIAKAVDAGYRLVIVLGGTLNLLRGQTQRRLDMELVGRENIVRNGGEFESDYADDRAWIEDGFVSFGAYPSTLGGFDIVRMTTRDDDYKSLLHGIVALEFEKSEPTKPLYDAHNLHRSNARLMVVKKNKTVLAKLVKDLSKIRTPLNEIPVLIVDDESDEASVNVRDLRKPNAERTAINQKISDLLKLLPRSQYVGYTATPFANVFIDPSDSEDIFPKDFIVSLPEPEGYMGVNAFHDAGSDIPLTERTVVNSNEKAHVRDVPADDDDSALREAIDAFVLAGAIKMYREDNGYKAKTFEHHTMLIHESMRMADHRELLVKTKRLWFDSGYVGPAGRERLRKLFDNDFAAVSKARADGYPVPSSFDDIAPFIGPTVHNIGGNENPVIVVNGDRDIETGVADFDKRRIWKILIGGQKLSRGFTVEGLTVSYFRRAPGAAATLMQMGRWFGFREGYRDLVRLYLGRSETLGRREVDLLDAFEAICLDEARFRDELSRYADPGEGKAQITPAQVPPLVYQHLPWLPPVARTKMFNARLAEISSAGDWQEVRAYPTKSADIRHNFNVWAPLLERVRPDLVELAAVDPNSGRTERLSAFVAPISAQAALDAFERTLWLRDDTFLPHLEFLRRATAERKIDDWLVVAPQHTAQEQSASISSDVRYSWFARDYRSDTGQTLGAVSSTHHRPALLRIAGNTAIDGRPETERLAIPRRGVIALFPVVTAENRDRLVVSDSFNPGETIMAFAFAAPTSARDTDGTVIRFTTIDASKGASPIIDATLK
ncbi:Z1 domain-containing protein [Gordonia malaquae]|uniref:Z1 domain-containing protein n=1 Tax=Gordonia malaquae TaxID=410332 RepID=UPI003019B0E7